MADDQYLALSDPAALHHQDAPPGSTVPMSKHQQTMTKKLNMTFEKLCVSAAYEF